MIRELRIKLVLASMLSLLLVLTVIIGAAAALSYNKMLSDSDGVLSILVENDGNFPVGDQPWDDAQGEAGEQAGNDRLLSPELPYESRYFSVALSEEGTVLSVNTGSIAAVDTQTAIEYAQQALDGSSARGFKDDYRYVVYSSGDETHVIFLDCGREMDSFRTFLATSAVVGLAGLGSVLILLIPLSGRIVRPFSENYEKQKRFITDAGHELKTPLTIIDADAEVLEMDVGKNEWLDDIKGQTKRLASLTNSLIFLARMEERPQLESIEFPVSDLVEETVDAFRALARTKNRALSASIESMLSMTGDEKSVRQLVTILLDNAVKYSDDGGAIEVALEKRRGALRLSVRNTVESISREDLAHLFDRFFRADRSRNSQAGGYGLGLSIASAIVSAHRGKISASTEDERSLVITVTFPL